MIAAGQSGLSQAEGEQKQLEHIFFLLLVRVKPCSSFLHVCIPPFSGTVGSLKQVCMYSPLTDQDGRDTELLQRLSTSARLPDRNPVFIGGTLGKGYVPIRIITVSNLPINRQR